MNEAKHSPAPWKHTFNSSKERGVRNSGGFICFLPKPSHWTGQDERYEADLIENKANATLIAAAPDLLEALKAVVRIADRKTVEFDLARAAISKAEQQ